MNTQDIIKGLANTKDGKILTDQLCMVCKKPMTAERGNAVPFVLFCNNVYCSKYRNPIIVDEIKETVNKVRESRRFTDRVKKLHDIIMNGELEDS